MAEQPTPSQSHHANYSKGSASMAAKARRDPAVFPLAVIVGGIALTAIYFATKKAPMEGGGSSNRGKPPAAERSYVTGGIRTRRPAVGDKEASVGGGLGMGGRPFTHVFGGGVWAGCNGDTYTVSNEASTATTVEY